MAEISAKRISVNYRCPPLWNAALNFLFWMLLATTSVIVLYLFLMYVMDGAIKRDYDSSSGLNIGDPANYDNIVEERLKAIPFLGRFLYP